MGPALSHVPRAQGRLNTPPSSRAGAGVRPKDSSREVSSTASGALRSLERVPKARDLVGQDFIDSGGKGAKSLLRVTADDIGQGYVGPFGHVLESPGHCTVDGHCLQWT